METRQAAPNSSEPETAVTGREPSLPGGATLLVPGCGGNIGSSLIPHVARIEGLGKAILIDPDRYESHNLSGQNIDPGDVGRRKADVMARRLRRINPDLDVEAIVARVEDVPLGLLRADIAASCLDSRLARDHVNRATRRLGVPYWVDAGVDPDGLLARVSVFRSPDTACYECGRPEGEDTSQEQARPCLGDAGGPPPTNSPSALGGLAASYQALEIRKILDGDSDTVAAGKQITISAAFHRYFVTALPPDPACPCQHEAWAIQALDVSPGHLSLGDALELEPAGAGTASLSVAGRTFVRHMQCTACGWKRALTRLEGRLTRAQRTCAKCGVPMTPVGFTRLERLSADVLPARVLAQPLARLGFEPGDVFTIEQDGREAHHELGG
ncbi:MAG: HesA/MoeB/ThiF family protein [Planctomycetota bacterium]